MTVEVLEALGIAVGIGVGLPALFVLFLKYADTDLSRLFRIRGSRPLAGGSEFFIDGSVISKSTHYERLEPRVLSVEELAKIEFEECRKLLGPYGS